MTTKMTKAFVTAQQRMSDRIADRESGQGALEYIGILAVVAVVIGLAVTAFTGAGETINTGVKTLLAEVFKTR